MRSAPLALTCLAAAALSACASTTTPREQGAIQRPNTLADAATTPLSDLNVKRVKIPDVLQRAVRDPYDPRSMGECRSIAAEIGRLDDALGPDADEVAAPDDRTRNQKRTDDAHSVAVTAMREGVASAIPFRGWVRQLSGAAKQQREVQQAITAGSIRRGYLKGVGMRLNCAPPAAPSWFTPVRAQPTPKRGSPRR